MRSNSKFSHVKTIRLATVVGLMISTPPPVSVGGV